MFSTVYTLNYAKDTLSLEFDVISGTLSVNQNNAVSKYLRHIITHIKILNP